MFKGRLLKFKIHNYLYSLLFLTKLYICMYVIYVWMYVMYILCAVYILILDRMCAMYVNILEGSAFLNVGTNISKYSYRHTFLT